MDNNYKYTFTYTNRNGVIIKVYSKEIEVAYPHRLDGPAVEYSDGKKC